APVVQWLLDVFLENEQLRPFPVPFYLMTAFVLVLVVEAPLSVACQYLLLPQLPALNLLLRLLLTALLGVWLVPTLGATGAGIAQVVGAVLSMAVLAVALTMVVRRRLKET